MDATACSVDGCSKPVDVRGWCKAHYTRVLRTGDPGPAEIQHKNPGAQCSIGGCSKPVDARGWCMAHYTRWLRTGDVGSVEIWDRSRAVCSIAGCDLRVNGHSYCSKHYQRWKANGDPLKARPKDGPESFFWAPRERLLYDTAHNHVHALRGKATEQDCVDCGGQAHDWAYDHNDPDQISEDGKMPYSADVDHYIPLCRKCHQRFDRQQREKESVG